MERGSLISDFVVLPLEGRGGSLMEALSVGGIVVGRFLRVVLMSEHCGFLSGSFLVGRLWVVSLVGNSLVSRGCG